jgi:hypothetical protein
MNGDRTDPLAAPAGQAIRHSMPADFAGHILRRAIQPRHILNALAARIVTVLRNPALNGSILLYSDPAE